MKIRYQVFLKVIHGKVRHKKSYSVTTCYTTSDCGLRIVWMPNYSTLFHVLVRGPSIDKMFILSKTNSGGKQQRLPLDCKWSKLILLELREKVSAHLKYGKMFSRDLQINFLQSRTCEQFPVLSFIPSFWLSKWVIKLPLAKSVAD